MSQARCMLNYTHRWIKQEAALARRLVFHHDHSQVVSKKVENFYDRFYRFHQGSNIEHDEEAYVSAGILVDLRDVMQLLKGYRPVFDNNGDRIISFMCDLRRYQVADVRDRIFGLSGIFSAFLEADLTDADYGTSPQDVYTRFTFDFITATKSLA